MKILKSHFLMIYSIAFLLSTKNSFCFTVLLKASSNYDEQISTLSLNSFFKGETLTFVYLLFAYSKIRPSLTSKDFNYLCK